MKPRKFIILDRDGTIIVERNYLSDPDQVELLPHAAEGLRQLQHLGFGLVVVTNQSGIGRGYFTETQLNRIHQRMAELLLAEKVTLDGIYVCPHRPEECCTCRKPQPGLLISAAADMAFEPSECFVVGDKPCDIDLGRCVGATTFLVRTGYGNQIALENTCHPDYIAADMVEVSCTITRLTQQESETQ